MMVQGKQKQYKDSTINQKFDNGVKKQSTTALKLNKTRVKTTKQQEGHQFGASVFNLVQYWEGSDKTKKTQQAKQVNRVLMDLINQ